MFNDYMDFKIVPWSKFGFDKGVMFPVRKMALRLLKKEIVKQKQERYNESHGVVVEEDDNGEQTTTTSTTATAQMVHDQVMKQRRQGDPNTYATRHSQRQEFNRVKTSRGESYTEVVTNTSQFPVPEYEDVQNWKEDSWLQFAAPLELESYYRQHPDKKPEGWIPPSSLLKKEEGDSSASS